MKLGAPHSWMTLVTTLLLSLGLALSTSVSAAPGDDQVTIYRCTDAQGRMSLRDTPCSPDERQQTREMQRPQDPPPTPSPAVAASVSATFVVPASDPPPAPMPARAPPTPVYRCTTPDGEQYTSDSPEGNPRWVPLWTLGYPVIFGPGHGHHSGRYPVPPVRPAGHSGYSADRRQTPNDGRPAFVFDSVGRPAPKPSRSQPGVPDRLPIGPLPIGGVVQGPGTWIRDTCTRIPQVEVCADLRDRRTALVRRYNSALQSERREIDREKRRIDERLNSQCQR